MWRAKVTLAPTLMTNLAEREDAGSRRPRGGRRACLFETRPGPRRVTGVWAVVPVKEIEGAKQRLSSCLSPEERRALASVMLEDVLDAVSAVRELAGLLVVTVDPVAAIARQPLRRAHRHGRRARRPYRRRRGRSAPASCARARQA